MVSLLLFAREQRYAVCKDFLYAGATTLAPTPAGKEQLGIGFGFRVSGPRQWQQAWGLSCAFQIR